MAPSMGRVDMGMWEGQWGPLCVSTHSAVHCCAILGGRTTSLGLPSGGLSPAAQDSRSCVSKKRAGHCHPRARLHGAVGNMKPGQSGVPWGWLLGVHGTSDVFLSLPKYQPCGASGALTPTFSPHWGGGVPSGKYLIRILKTGACVWKPAPEMCCSFPVGCLGRSSREGPGGLWGAQSPWCVTGQTASGVQSRAAREMVPLPIKMQGETPALGQGFVTQRQPGDCGDGDGGRALGCRAWGTVLSAVPPAVHSWGLRGLQTVGTASALKPESCGLTPGRPGVQGLSPPLVQRLSALPWPVAKTAQGLLPPSSDQCALLVLLCEPQSQEMNHRPDGEGREHRLGLMMSPWTLHVTLGSSDSLMVLKGCSMEPPGGSPQAGWVAETFGLAEWAVGLRGQLWAQEGPDHTLRHSVCTGRKQSQGGQIPAPAHL